MGAIHIVTLFHLRKDVPGLTDAKAIVLLEAAMEKNDLRAAMNLSRFYALGRGVEKDLTKATQLREKAGDLMDQFSNEKQ